MPPRRVRVSGMPPEIEEAINKFTKGFLNSLSRALAAGVDSLAGDAQDLTGKADEGVKNFRKKVAKKLAGAGKKKKKVKVVEVVDAEIVDDDEN